MPEPHSKNLQVLDGPVGTALEARGHLLEAPLWSASAIDAAPEALAKLHADYAASGATVHTAATFRTARAPLGWTDRAVQIARGAIPPDHRLFGSVSPFADCYRPWDTPDDIDLLRAYHQAHCDALARSGCDGLLVETFADAREHQLATQAAHATGLEVWSAMSAGPDGSLFEPTAVAERVDRVAGAGASTVLLNCIGLDHIGPFTEALADAARSVGLPWGVYPNAGRQDGPFGWSTPGSDALAAEASRPAFERFSAQGATVLGGCCGMDVAHIRMIAGLAG